MFLYCDCQGIIRMILRLWNYDSDGRLLYLEMQLRLDGIVSPVVQSCHLLYRIFVGKNVRLRGTANPYHLLRLNLTM
jgi:hypothetical protein